MGTFVFISSTHMLASKEGAIWDMHKRKGYYPFSISIPLFIVCRMQKMCSTQINTKVKFWRMLTC